MDEGLSPHTTWSYAKAGRTAAEDYAAVIEAMAARPEIDGSRVIAAGVSGGGFAVTALASKPPAGLVGVVNFSGGRGSPKSYRNHNEEALVGAFAEFGTTARVPALWLYSMTDRFFWPKLVDRMWRPMRKGARRYVWIESARSGSPGRGMPSSDPAGVSSGVRASPPFCGSLALPTGRPTPRCRRGHLETARKAGQT